VAQRAVSVQEGWSVEDLEEAIHAVEHVLYPEVLRVIAEGRMSLDENRHVCIA